MTVQKLHILLAEDDEDDVLFFREALSDLPLICELAVVSNGEHAVNYFSESNCAPDFVFLDINMPKLNGIEALKAIKAIQSSDETHVIMLSTSITEFMVEQSYHFGASMYIQKPTQFGDLRQYILYCLTQLSHKPADPGFILNQHFNPPVS